MSAATNTPKGAVPVLKLSGDSRQGTGETGVGSACRPAFILCPSKVAYTKPRDAALQLLFKADEDFGPRKKIDRFTAGSLIGAGLAVEISPSVLQITELGRECFWHWAGRAA